MASAFDNLYNFDDFKDFENYYKSDDFDVFDDFNKVCATIF